MTNCIAANHLNSTKVSWYFQKILSLAQVVKYTLYIFTHISSQKMTLWIVIIFPPARSTTKQSPSTIGRRRDHLGSFTVKRFLILFDYLSPYYWNISFFSPIWIRLEGSYIFKVFKDQTNDFCNSKFCKLFFSKLTKLTEAEISNFFYSRDFHTISLYYFF